MFVTFVTLCLWLWAFSVGAFWIDIVGATKNSFEQFLLCFWYIIHQGLKFWNLDFAISFETRSARKLFWLLNMHFLIVLRNLIDTLEWWQWHLLPFPQEFLLVHFEFKLSVQKTHFWTTVESRCLSSIILRNAVAALIAKVWV